MTENPRLLIVEEGISTIAVFCSSETWRGWVDIQQIVRDYTEKNAYVKLVPTEGDARCYRKGEQGFFREITEASIPKRARRTNVLVFDKDALGHQVLLADAFHYVYGEK